ncbi:hypothetical protein WH47_03660 [Habropoda laboriosa]|uniref:Uncharacterized protein n=1 Tax=Habropoda laboriosa TaxID=597456 RepID=A0A0L7RII8_9HYME|nr:hypothetical protein WH47_03660 [Habropoda laboriosa]
MKNILKTALLCKDLQTGLRRLNKWTSRSRYASSGAKKEKQMKGLEVKLGRRSTKILKKQQTNLQRFIHEKPKQWLITNVYTGKFRQDQLANLEANKKNKKIQPVWGQLEGRLQGRRADSQADEQLVSEDYTIALRSLGAQILERLDPWAPKYQSAQKLERLDPEAPRFPNAQISHAQKLERSDLRAPRSQSAQKPGRSDTKAPRNYGALRS